MDLDYQKLGALGRDIARTTSTWATRDGVLEVRTSRVSSGAHAPTVHSLATHTLRSATAALDLFDRGQRLEAMPLIRSAWECSVTAMWAADSREGSAGIHEESRRQRRELLRGMKEMPGISPFDPAERIAHSFGEVLPTSSEAYGQARRFEQRCRALKGVGQPGYTIYRALSAYCHPSSSLLDCYLQKDDGPAQVKLLHQPQGFEGDTWPIYLNVLAMMWGARAFDVMTVDQPHRSYLRGVARTLETGTDIARLTDEARGKEAEAEKARRRAHWKGPRRRT